VSQSIPLKSVPNQTLQVQLDGQACTINAYQTDYGFYVDLLLNGVPVVTGTLCRNLKRIVRSIYLGFNGDLIFCDTQGTNDPVYTGLGTRYQLTYLELSDLNGVG
jgi:hypothetical protein